MKNIDIALIGPNSNPELVNGILSYFEAIDKKSQDSFSINLYHWSGASKAELTLAESKEKEGAQKEIDRHIKIHKADLVYAVYSDLKLGTKIKGSDLYRTEGEIYSASEKGRKVSVFFRKHSIDDESDIKERESFSKRSEFIDKLNDNANDKRIFTDFFEDFEEIKQTIFGDILRHIFDMHQVDLSGFTGTLISDQDAYLDKTADLIGRAEKEVLFTSTSMRYTQEENASAHQEKIIRASESFEGKRTKVRHLGVVAPNGITTLPGAVELRARVSNIAIRSYERLNHYGINFLICDGKHVLIRKSTPSSDKESYAVYFEDDGLADILSRSFYRLWQESKFMYKWIEEALAKNDGEFRERLIHKLSKAGQLEDGGWSKFFDQIKSFDIGNKFIPNRYNEKVIPTLAPYSFDSKTLKNLGRVYEIDDINKTIISGQTEKGDLEAISSSIHKNIAIDYNSYSHSFFRLYFAANFFKAIHSLKKNEDLINECLDKKKRLKILDVGGGGGASALAISEHLEGLNFKLTVLDKNKRQLDLTRSILSTIFSDMKPKYVPEDAYEFLPKKESSYDLVIASNFLCEAESQRETCLFNLMCEVLSPNGVLLLVERCESKIYDKLLLSKKFMPINYMSQNKRYRIPHIEEMKSLLGDSKSADVCKTEYTLRYGLYRRL